MSNQNDQKIKDYREKVEAKRKSLGEKPKLNYVTNALLTMPDNTRLNLNLLQTAEGCVDVVQQLLLASDARDKANQLLGTNLPCIFGNYALDQWIQDIKMRLSVIQWETGKKALDAMDANLAQLLSNEAKTSQAIDDIAKMLEDDSV